MHILVDPLQDIPKNKLYISMSVRMSVFESVVNHLFLYHHWHSVAVNVVDTSWILVAVMVSVSFTGVVLCCGAGWWLLASGPVSGCVCYPDADIDAFLFGKHLPLLLAPHPHPFHATEDGNCLWNDGFFMTFLWLFFFLSLSFLLRGFCSLFLSQFSCYFLSHLFWLTLFSFISYYFCISFCHFSWNGWMEGIAFLL